MNKMSKEGAIKMKYVCNWPRCGNTFEREVRTIEKCSDQVKCPKCDNFLKTGLKGDA